ncbi:MAG: F0F1 ATP synthase subunit epsilon [Candidatus Methylomirabilales bacterium]
MAETFRLEIVTPEERLVSEEVRELVAPGTEGYFGVLPGHIPFVTTLDTGELTYRVDGTERHLAISGGYAEVRRDRVIVLADRAERAEDIDAPRAERARDRAAQRIQQWSGGAPGIDAARAQAALQRAVTRLAVASKGR